MLITEKTTENEMKIAIFDVGGNSIPLYEKNLAIVESITIIKVKIKMKMSEFFLVNVTEKTPLNFPLRSRDLEGIAKGFSKGN
jgi:hypothetical protein